MAERRSYLGQAETEVSPGQHWFEKGLKYVVAAGLGFGLASAVYNVPDLQAQHEWMSKVLAGKYPGIFVAQGTGQDCIPLDVKPAPGERSSSAPADAKP